MPRLEGQKANPTMTIILIVVILALIFLGLEYFGVLNLIPGFGKDGGAANA